jgi:putative component of membrane protein insertase Oxa1/YidC/SpoIIIJ protein YidD
MIQAVNEWGIFYGVFLGIRRITKCHPWGGSGDDPIPKKKK